MKYGDEMVSTGENSWLLEEFFEWESTSNSTTLAISAIVQDSVLNVVDFSIERR